MCHMAVKFTHGRFATKYILILASFNMNLCAKPKKQSSYNIYETAVYIIP